MTNIGLVVVALAALGCGGGKGGDCEQVVDHLMGIVNKLDTRGESTPEERAENRKKGLEQCQKMTPDARSCMAATKTVDDIMACMKKHDTGAGKSEAEEAKENDEGR